MQTWYCNIEKAQNGYIVEHFETVDEENFKKISNVFEEQDVFSTVEETDFFQELKGCNSEQRSFAKMVYYLAEYFGIKYDKYGKTNLRISFDKAGYKL
jgi:hypothetical protein